MKITFLGTSAANAYPEAFCCCDNCTRARELGGRSLRKRSAVLIDDDLLIDLGPDIMTASQMHGVDLTNVSYCLQTHPHADHLDASHLLSRSPGYGTVGAPRLRFYASGATLEILAGLLERDCAPHGLWSQEAARNLNLSLQPVSPFTPFSAGPYRITPVPANHDPAVEALLYAIEKDGRCIFYGTDTATLPEDTWNGLHACGFRFDTVVLDHTYGPAEPGTDHLSARQLMEHAARMRAEGLLCADARILATHISHEGNPPHPELSQFALRNGYEVAYDGLTV